MILSVVIPAYNEEENISKTLADVASFLPDAEIIVVNDASTDTTAHILRDTILARLKVLTNKQNMGHGYSVVRGLKEAQGDYVLYIDADRQIELTNLKQLNDMDSGMYDFISGKRMHRNDKAFRKVISFCLRYTILCRHQMYVRDSNCPFKLYKRNKLVPLLDKLPTSYIVPIACLEVLARKSKLKTLIIPTPHHPYDGVRKGFLQSFNIKMYLFLWSAFWEVVRL